MLFRSLLARRHATRVFIVCAAVLLIVSISFGRMYQTPFSDRVRQEAGIATIAVGAISEADHVNSIIAAGRADLCAVARPHLANPAWTLTEAARIGYAGLAWPQAYRAGKPQLEANFAREKAARP